VRGYGFEDSVASGSNSVTSNFSGAADGAYFTTSIISKALTLGDANTTIDPISCSDTTYE
jgi:hypothetical protein